MASVDVQVNLQLSQRQLNAVTRQIQSSLGNLSTKNLTTIDRELNKGAKSAQTFGDAIGLSARRFVAYTSAVAVVGRLSSALARATRDAIKFEREFVKLAQVFDTSVKSLGSLSGEISNLSKEFGINANVIARTSVVLAQSGLSARDTEKALRALAKTTLASTFEDIGSTAEGAVAILAQFGAGVGALESQLGSINAVAKKFAVESGDIIEAVRRAGGAFNAAGGNLEEFIALFTSVRSTTRESAETIATGFRTIFGRIQRPKTIEYFRQLNIELTDGQGNFIGAFEAVKRLSQGLEQAGIRVGSLKFAEVVEQLGGIRQISRVIPLLTQFGKAQQALNVAQTGSASLTADVAKAQETLSQAFARTQENFSALIREISQTETFQSFVRIALSLANAFIEVARSLKPLIPLIGALGAIKLGGIATQAIKRAGSSGSVLQFNRGGQVPGSGNGDTVPAMLEPGEFVIRKSAVQAFGAENLAGINKYATGGVASLSNNKSTIRNYYDVNRSPNGVEDQYNVVPKRIALKNRSVYRESASKIWSEASKIFEKSGKNPANLYIKSNTGGFAGVGSQTLGNSELRPGNSEEQRLNKITGGLAEYDVQKSLPGAKKLNDARGPDFSIPGGKYVEVKTNKGRVSDSELIAKAVLGRGISARGKLKQGKEDTVNPKLDFYYAKFSKGGAVGTDTVPALLTPGEFVINKKSAEAYGYGNLKKINKYAKGGVVQKFANGGEAGFLSGSFSPDRVLGTLAGLSLAISTLTAVFDDAEQTMKPLIAALATFSTVIVGLNAVISKIGGSKLATAIQGKIGEKFQRGLNPRGDAVDSEVAKKVTKEIADASADNSRNLLRIISLLQSINRNLGGFSRSRGLRGRDSSGRLLSRDRRTTAGIIGQIRSAGGAKKGVIGGAASSASKALSGLKIAASIASVAVTAAISIVAAEFTFAAESARQLSEKAIKAGDIQLATAKAAEVASAESSKQGILAFGGLGTAIGSLFGPIGTVVGGIVGLVAGLSLGEEAVYTLAKAFFSTANKFIEFIRSIPVAGSIADNLFDLSAIQDKLAEVSVSFSPELKKATAEINALTKAFANASQKITEGVNKNIETFEKQLKLATTDTSRQEIFDKIYEEIKDGNRLYSKKQADQEKVLKGIRGRRDRALADPGLDPRQRQALFLKFAKEEKRAKEELNNTIKEESTARISQTAKVFESARAYGDAARAEKELNAGRLAQRDANNIITRESLQANGELIKVFNILREAGLSEEQALTELTLAIDGTESAAKKLQKQFENQVKYLGSSFRKLFTGQIEGRLKAAQNISGALDIASGVRGISSFAPSQQEGVINEFASLVQAGLIDENAIVSAFQSALPPSIFADLQNALSTQEDPTKALQDVASAFFGLDPIQKEIADNTKRTADAAEDLANGGIEGALPNSRGGAIYAAGGTLVNFKPKGTDTVPAMLTPGEFVIKKSSVDKYGTGMMKEINAGRYQTGGSVQDYIASKDSTVNPMSPEERNRLGVEFISKGIIEELTKGFFSNVDEEKLANLYTQIPTKELVQQIWAKVAAATKDSQTLEEQIKATMDVGFEADLRRAIDQHTAKLNSGIQKPVQPAEPQSQQKQAAEVAKQEEKKVPPEEKKVLKEATTISSKDKYGPTDTVDLVEYYNAQLGFGTATSEEAKNIDLNNKILLQRLRANEIANARTAGLQRKKLGGGQFYAFSGTNPFLTQTEFPYPDSEKFRNGRQLLSSDEKEYYAYLGANEGKIQASSASFEYFKKNYDLILAGKDPRTLRLNENERVKELVKTEGISPGVARRRAKREADPTAQKRFEESQAKREKFKQYREQQKEKKAQAIADIKGDLNAIARIQRQSYEYINLLDFPAYSVFENWPDDDRKLIRGEIDTNLQSILSQRGEILKRAKKYGFDDIETLLAESRKDLVSGVDSKGNKVVEFKDMAREAKDISLTLQRLNPADIVNSLGLTFTKASSYHTGGMVRGYGQKPIYAEGGEFVMNKNAVKNIGVDNLNKLNGAQGLQTGGKMSISVPSELTTGLSSFEQSISNFASILSNNTIPNEITMSLGNQTISVNLNGAELLAGLMPEIQSLVNNAVVTELIDYDQKSQSSGPGSYSTQKSAERYNT